MVKGLYRPETIVSCVLNSKGMETRLGTGTRYVYKYTESCICTSVVPFHARDIRSLAWVGGLLALGEGED